MSENIRFHKMNSCIRYAFAVIQQRHYLGQKVLVSVIAVRAIYHQFPYFLPACSVDNLRKFVQQFVDGELEPYIKSEPVPEDNDGPVTVSNFDILHN